MDAAPAIDGLDKEVTQIFLDTLDENSLVLQSIMAEYQPDDEIGDLSRRISDAEEQRRYIGAEEFDMVDMACVCVNITEVINPNYPRATSPEFQAAKPKDFEGLQNAQFGRLFQRCQLSR